MLDIPSKGYFGQTESFFLCHGLQATECVEIRLPEISFAIHFADIGIDVRVSSFSWNLIGFILAAEHSTRERIVSNNAYAILSTIRNPFILDRSGERVVHRLIYCRVDPASFIGNVPYLCDLPSGIVA